MKYICTGGTKKSPIQRAVSSSVGLCQVSQRHHAALHKLYIHPWAVVAPQLHLTPKAGMPRPLLGPWGCVMDPAGVGSCWPPRMLEATCFCTGGTTVCCSKHEKIPNQVELIEESK